MTNDLDHNIRHAINTLVSTAPDIGPAPHEGSVASPHEPRRRLALAIAAAITVIAGIAAVTYLDAPSTETAPASVVVGPALLQRRPDSGVTIDNRQFFDASTLEAGGAVIAPDGTVFGLIPITTQTLDTVPPTYEERTVAGLNAWAAEDGSAPTQTRRGIEIGCGTLSVTTGQGPMWPTALDTLAGSIEADPDGITLTLPDRWRSLGAATSASQYSSTLTATIDGVTYRLFSRQAINQPVGMFLSSTETNPSDISKGTETMWHSEGGTTPGYNTIVSHDGTTLLEISGQAPLEVLLEVADALEPVPADEWLTARLTEENDSPPMSTEGAVINACEQRTLVIAN